jgi:hypothetical protein
VPWNLSEASRITAAISDSVRTVKPWRISRRNVPPGGSRRGLGMC